jgi:hypothetical protein
MEVSGQLHDAAALPPAPRERASSTHCVGPRSFLHAVENRKHTPRVGNRNPDYSAVQRIF